MLPLPPPPPRYVYDVHLCKMVIFNVFLCCSLSKKPLGSYNMCYKFGFFFFNFKTSEASLLKQVSIAPFCAILWLFLEKKNKKLLHGVYCFKCRGINTIANIFSSMLLCKHQGFFFRKPVHVRMLYSALSC